MAGTFDFCTGSRVIEELPPEEPTIISMNGWDFAAKPKVPYRREFKVSLMGMRWYLNSGGTALDITTDPTNNAGRLLQFYRDNRMWDNFTLAHEYLGSIQVRFNKPVQIPAGLPDSFGRIDRFEVSLIEYNPSYT